MAKTKLIPKKRLDINFNSRRFAAAKEIGRKKQINPKNVKIKVLLPQSKNMEVKKRGQVIRNMRVRRKTIFPARVRNRTYG